MYMQKPSSQVDSRFVRICLGNRPKVPQVELIFGERSVAKHLENVVSSKFQDVHPRQRPDDFVPSGQRPHARSSIMPIGFTATVDVFA